jgi:hypothetical protein
MMSVDWLGISARCWRCEKNVCILGQNMSNMPQRDSTPRRWGSNIRNTVGKNDLEIAG